MGANDFAAHYELATLAEKRGEFALAAEHYEKAWRILPGRRSVLVDLGRAFTALGRSDRANAALLSAVFGGEARAAESARELLADRFPYVAEFRRALLFDPGNPDLRRELAYLLLRMDRQSEAEVEFRYLADNFAEDLLSATQLGFILQNRGDRKAAQVLFDRVLAGKDEDLANRVRAVLRLPQTLQSRTDSGSSPVDNKVMAERSLKAGYLKDAVKYLRGAHETDPGDFGVMLQLGWTYNILHEDSRAFEWFDRARKSSDPQVASEAEKAWRNLRSANQIFRTTGWFYPMYSSRWHDGFGYAQVKTEVRATAGLHFYASTRLVGDTRLGVGVLPPNLSERAVIVGGGVMAGPWHGLVAWGEAGESIGYFSGHMLPDYRGGLSYGRGFGHGLRSESGGFFADTAADLVFVSRFGNDTLLYDQSRVGYTFGPAGFRAQLYWNGNVTVDQQRQPWANFGETGPGIRMGGAMYFTFNLVRGVYFVRHDNPRAPMFNDFRAGVWYAFTR
jgi:tetratricopeptide (TPR) repeat protein